MDAEEPQDSSAAMLLIVKIVVGKSPEFSNFTGLGMKVKSDFPETGERIPASFEKNREDYKK